MKKKRLKLADIRLDGDTQPRVAIDEDLVAEYADAYAAGVNLPPLVVFYDGASYWLVDGFHRRWAAIKAAIKSVPCIVHEGTLQDARWFSYATNQAHGLRRSNPDKAKAVKQALKHPAGVKMSDRQIAEHVGVHHDTVAKYRAELDSTGEIRQSVSKRTGKDGIERSLPIVKNPKVPKQISVPPSDTDQVRCRCCGRDVEPDEDGDCPLCHEPEIALRMPHREELTPRAYLDDDGQVVAVIHGLNDRWFSARGRHRVKSPMLPPRKTWEGAQVDLDAYAAERGWQLHETNQPVAVEEAPAVELGVPLESRPNWLVDVGAIAYAAIECEGRPAVAQRLQELADEILMG